MDTAIIHTTISIKHRVFIFIALCLIVVCAGAGAKVSKVSKKAKEDPRVYLDKADELMYDIMGPRHDAQFARGHVHFRHKGAVLTCDSAYYYQMSNSFKAFGHVKMVQGDTVTLTGQYAYYDGNTEMAQVRHDVVLTHRLTKLYCDSLNYDRLYSYGYFFNGGKLVDRGNTLISDWGQYSTATRQADFYYHCTLTSKKFVITGDTIHYDTQTKNAHLVGPTKIVATKDKSTVLTTNGYYNTTTDQAQLFSRSTVNKSDGKSITADSLYNNSKTGVSEGFNNVIYKDPINKNILTTDYFWYNDQNGSGYATKNPVVKDFSQKDTLYVHAEKMRIETFNINTDSVYRLVHAYPHVRAFRHDVQAVCDSLVMNSQDTCMTMYRDPVCWSDNRQLLGEKIMVYMNDSTIRFAHVIGQALSVEKMQDGEHYNQIASQEMKAWFEHGNIRLNQAEKNVEVVYFPIDDSDSTLIGMNTTQTDTMKMYIGPDRRLQRIWMPKHKGILYPMTQIPAGKDHLASFAWFDYMRPISKDDIYIWRPKKSGTELKAIKRHDAPTQSLNSTP